MTKAQYRVALSNIWSEINSLRIDLTHGDVNGVGEDQELHLIDAEEAISRAWSDA